MGFDAKNRPSASVWGLGTRALLRDWRAGELRLLMASLILAVSALTAVGFFTDRLQHGLRRDAAQLLGADAVVASDQAPPAALVQAAAAGGLQAVQTLSFPSMARAPDARGGAARLVALKSVAAGYPLRGALKLRSISSPRLPNDQSAHGGAGGAGEPLAKDDEKAQGIPAAGTVWVEAAVLAALGLQVGDPLLLGEASLRIERVIVQEPDKGAGFLSFAPRVLMNEADLAATALVQPASRISWRLLVASDSGQAGVQAFVRWAEQHIKAQGWRGVRMESLETGRPEMSQTLNRAERFLKLVSLLTALLCAVAVAIAARSFANAHLNDCAMQRVLGLSQRRMLQSFCIEFLLAALVASAVGVLVGYALHEVLVQLLAGILGASLPAPSLWPALWGAGVGLCLLVAFGLPPIVQLASVPALRVLRRDVGEIRAASWLVLGLGFAGFAALLLALSDDLWLGLIAVGGFAAAALLFAGMSYGATLLLRRCVSEARAPTWLLLATRQVVARPALTVVQCSALAVGLLALMLLVLLRTDLVSSWRKATPPDAPNRFVINIQPEQAAHFQSTLRQAGVQRYDWYPMLRGRLVAINGQAVRVQDFADERAQRLVDREFNLSYSASLPTHNQVVAGQWAAGEVDGISFEEGLAKTLKLKMGDRLRFDLGGLQKEARITSLRKVDWTSMRVNFFAIFPVSQLDWPQTYITAFKAPVDGFALDNALVRVFPNITAVDLSSTIAQVQAVLGQVIRAVEFLFGFSLLAGLIVLWAAVSATREQRAREYALLRALGAGSVLLRRVQRAELAGVGLLAGLLASLAASAVAALLAQFVFEFQWLPSPWVLLGGSALGAVLAWAAGWWGLRDVLRRPVVQTLRQVAE
jgi:putative ABC transport system permease protein